MKTSKQFLAFIEENAATQTPDTLHDAFEIMRFALKRSNARVASSFKLGDAVRFKTRKVKYQGRMVRGIVTQINRSTIGVLETQTKMAWRVTPGLLERDDEAAK